MLKKDKVVSFRMESRIDEKVDQLARRNGMTRGEQYREIVKYYFLNPIKRIFK